MRRLARVEAARLVRHPLVVLGVVVGGLVGWTLSDGQAFVLARESITWQLASLPVGAGAFLASFLAVTRPHRHGLAELYEAHSARPHWRTIALCLAALAPALLTAVGVSAGLGAIWWLGGTGGPMVLEAATAPAVVWMAGTLGVLLGRLIRHPMWAVLGVVLLVAAQLLVSPIGALRPSTLGLLTPVVNPPATVFDPWALVRPAGWHLGYVLAVGAVAGGLAVLVDRRELRRAGLTGLAAAVALAAGWAQTSATPVAAAEAAAKRVAAPSTVAGCEPAGSAQVCVLAGFERWRSTWAAPVAGVLERAAEVGLPTPDLRVLQRADATPVADSLRRWFDSIGRLLDTDETDPVPAATTITVGTEWPAGAEGARTRLLLALETAREVVGMPYGRTAPVEGDEDEEFVVPCSAVGQAREVVAVWLGATSYPGGLPALREVVTDEPYRLDLVVFDDGEGYALMSGPNHFELRSRDEVLGNRFEPRWSKVATNLALQLAERDRAAVLDAVAADWDRWSAPATSVRELVAAFDLRPLPTGADVPGAAGIPGGARDHLVGFRDTPLPADAPSETTCR